MTFDNKRVGYNADNNSLALESTGDLETTTNVFDILSNGFKVRITGDPNVSGDTYVYMAFAESPLVNSNGVPCNAR